MASKIEWVDTIHPTGENPEQKMAPGSTINEVNLSAYEQAKEAYEIAKEGYEMATEALLTAQNDVENARKAVIAARQALILAVGNDKLEDNL